MQIQERVCAYYDINEQIKQLEKIKSEHKAAIEAEYVKKDGLAVNGFKVLLTPMSRDTLNNEQIKEEWPRLWAFLQRFMKTTYFTQLRVSAEKEKKAA